MRTAQRSGGELIVDFHITRSADILRDFHPFEDKVKIGNDTLIGVEVYGSLIVLLPNKTGGITVRLETVAYVFDLAFNPCSFMAAVTRLKRVRS